MKPALGTSSRYIRYRTVTAPAPVLSDVGGVVAAGNHPKGFYKRGEVRRKRRKDAWRDAARRRREKIT